jgi:hypothetical protein
MRRKQTQFFGAPMKWNHASTPAAAEIYSSRHENESVVMLSGHR